MKVVEFFQNLWPSMFMQQKLTQWCVGKLQKIKELDVACPEIRMKKNGKLYILEEILFCRLENVNF